MQAQCPNCSGYKTEKRGITGQVPEFICGFVVLFSIGGVWGVPFHPEWGGPGQLLVAVLSVAIGLSAARLLINLTKKPKSMSYRCWICGYEWSIALGYHKTPAKLASVHEAQADAMASTGVASSGDLLDLVDKLAALRDSGAITDGEFAAKKAELLGRI